MLVSIALSGRKANPKHAPLHAPDQIIIPSIRVKVSPEVSPKI
jgi:hypothetical protein